MDFGKAFTYMFQDPDWLTKLGIGTLVTLVGLVLMPVLIGVVPLIIVLGYSLVALDNARLGHEQPLPKWQDWGRFFALGLKVSVALFIWALPIIIGMVPIIAGGVLSDNSGNSGGLGFISAMLIICGSCLMFLWGIFVTLLTPAIYTRIAATNRFGAAFDLGKIWGFTKDNLGNVIIAILLTWLAGLAASVLAMIGFAALIIGAMITFPLAMLWQYLVQSHLFGQIAANSVTSIE
jgi:hypothetical protein